MCLARKARTAPASFHPLVAERSVLLPPSKMGKRKRSSVEDAVIVLLTEGFDTIDHNLLAHIERKLRQSLNARRVVRDDSQSSASRTSATTPATPATPTMLATTLPSCVSDALSETPSGPLGQFLYQLLFTLPKITEFFSAGAKEILSQSLARADSRIEILKKFSRPGELTLSDKFERLLTERSLALSYERYHNGKGTVKAFAKSLRFTKNEDKSLAMQGIYRGKTWRNLENEVGESGMSAVACCEHTLFKKGVRADEMEKLAAYLKLSIFKPVLELAEKVSPLLEEVQRAFDKSIDIATESTDTRGSK
jgi:hypothetical protein